MLEAEPSQVKLQTEPIQVGAKFFRHNNTHFLTNSTINVGPLRIANRRLTAWNSLSLSTWKGPRLH